MIYTYSSPMGEFPLSLDSRDPSLRPFDAADEYILNIVKESRSGSEKILTVNDSQGALTVPLEGRCTAMVQDSYRDRVETAINLERNGSSPLPSYPVADLKECRPDLILMKIPKSVDFFRYQLRQIASETGGGVPILAGGMSRYLPAAFYEVFHEFCSSSSYSRIVKKARVYEGVLKPAVPAAREPEKAFDYSGTTYFSLPGVFSHGKLDAGSRFLLNWISSSEGKKRLRRAEGGVVADPGCGSGVLGLEADRIFHPRQIIFSDDSAMALASTRDNARRAGAEKRALFLHTNVLEGLDEESADLVLCNPPFHRGHSVALDTGFLFIRESSRVLKTGGLALFVVNRTLGYGNIIKENFSTLSIAGENSRYKLILCRK